MDMFLSSFCGPCHPRSADGLRKEICLTSGTNGRLGNEIQNPNLSSQADTLANSSIVMYLCSDEESGRPSTINY